MAIKIIDLQSETAPSDDDLLIIRDNATGITRKITRAVLFTSPPIPAGTITGNMIAAGTITKANLDPNAKISVRVNSLTSPSVITLNCDLYDVCVVTALTSNLTVNAPSGTPIDGQGVLYRILASSSASYTLTWSGFWALGITIPTSIGAGKHIYVSTRYNSPMQRWDVLSVGRD